MKVHGFILIKNRKLLVSKDKHDDFYKIPGGKSENNETGIQTAIRELKEETGLEANFIRKLSKLILEKNPTTEKKQIIKLHHYLGEPTEEIQNFKTYKRDNNEISWIELDKINKYDVAPNIKFLLEKGELE